MRALVITSTFPRYPGDNQPTFILDLAQHLPDTEVTVLAPADPNAPRDEKIGDAHILRFRYAPFSRWEKLAYGSGMLANLKGKPWLWLVLPLFLVSLCRNIYRLCLSGRFQVVHAHWLLPQGFCAALALSLIPRRNRPKLLVTAHGVDVHSLNGPIGRMAKRFVMRRADAVTAVSKALAQRLGEVTDQIGKGTVEVAPMGIAIPEAQVCAEREGFCFVGRFVEKKGLIDLVLAYTMAHSQLDGRMPGLTLAGDGPLREEVRSLIHKRGIEEHIKFVGWLDHEQVNALIGRSELLLMPSRRAESGDHEGLGLVAVESICLGTPVLAYDFDALDEIKSLGGGVRAVPEGNIEALAAAMVELAEGLDGLTVSEHVIAKARIRFNWVAVGTAYRARYDAISRP